MLRSWVFNSATWRHTVGLLASNAVLIVTLEARLSDGK